MEKYLLELLVVVLVITGCGKTEGFSKLEKVNEEEYANEDDIKYIISDITMADVMTAYITDQTNSKVYEFSNEEVKDFIALMEDIHIIKKSADSSEAFLNKITLKIFKESEYGYDEIYTFAEADGILYLAEGWNESGEYVYYKLRSDKLLQWIDQVKESASLKIEREAW